MSRQRPTAKSLGFRVLVVSAALIWVAADVAHGAQGRAGSSRSSTSSSSSKSSPSRASAPSQSSSGRSAVSRSSSGSRSSAPSRGSVRSGSHSRSRGGAARTRTSTRSSSRHYGHGGRHRGYYGGYYGGGYYGLPYYWSPWGYWGWGLTFGHGYGAYGGYGHYPPVVYSSRPGYRMGALDLKVRPKNTEIYVDGQFVGLARQYDGFPGHLWLERGVYEVGFYRPGFETQTRTVKIMTNLIFDLDVEMLPGEAVKPEMRFAPGEMERESDDELAEWRRRGPRGDYQARLHLDVEPAQALIYLDGNVLGTGSELAGLHAGLILSAGTHTLEVVHRGFETIERSIVVEPGEEVDFVLTLEPTDGTSP